MAMKLSDIQGERTIDVVVELVAPVSRIVKDKKVRDAFKGKEKPKNGEKVEPAVMFMDKMSDVLPSLLKDHKSDFIEIMATIEGVTIEEYTESLNLAKLFTDVISLMTDEAFTDFLP